MERLQKIIAQSGFCSRRKAEEYIQKGLVTVNGQKVTQLGLKFNYDDQIMIDGHCLENKEEKEYYLLYKPRGVVTTVSDEFNRPKVVDFIPTKTRIYPVGRLDYDTTGLLLLTNDGELTNILTHPSNKIEKIYTAKVKGIISSEEFMKIKKGLKIDNRLVKVTYLKIKKIDKVKETTTISIGIMEGRNHIVKRLFKSLNHEVLKLKRETLAFLNLQGLKSGEYRSLSIKEVKKLYALK